ncbi:imm11 family protein [Roseimicrobium gellanilyticum]|uniref:imm11 family protein n=1 Tax=Roseimicrobium gellanilyticum TaxID=748857 RepID=UPI0011BE6E81|nr:DUF1629 domain-containing protein [Roseimicrobium gellanilyticum]
MYKLEMICDDPLYEGLALSLDLPSRLGQDSLVDDITPGVNISPETRLWSQPNLAPGWQPPRCDGAVRPENDYPCINLFLPAFSKRAYDALSDLLLPNGELLPLVTHAGSFFFFNVTTIVDALDLEASKCKFWCDPPTTAVNVYHFEFLPDRLKGLSIFRILELPSFTFVTETFVERVKAAGLQGFCFRKVSPIPPDEHWRKNELILR